MRLLFLFLLLVNGFIYLWYTLNSEPLQAMSLATDPDAPRLVLLSEQNILPEVQIGVDTEAAAPGKGQTASINASTQQAGASMAHCYTLGPFMNEDSVSDASRGLMETGRPFARRASEKKELIGYWVMIPPLKNEDAARVKIQELKLMGDKHHYIVREPAVEKFAISLGVFHSRKNAERRHSKMKNLGYSVKLEGRYRQNPVYWLDYTEQESHAQLDLARFVGAQRLPRVCEAIASN